jgi:uncharacterized membrane protein
MGTFWRQHFQRRAGEEAGAVLVVVCVAMVAMIGATGLAVDIGRVTVNNRNLQAKADVIALDAARALSGQTAAQLSGASGAVVVAAQNSATRNNVPFSSLTVDLGTLSGSTFTTIATPVVNGAIQTVNSTSVPTAVRVTAAGTVNFLFDLGSPHGSKSTTRSAVATQQSEAGFSIGSSLLSVSSGNGTVLGALFGDAFHLNAVSYTGLVGATVSLKQIGLNMPASVGVLSPTQLLTTSVSINDFMLASIAALNAQGNTTAATVLNNMILNASATGTVKLGDFVNVAAGAENAAANASLDVLGILTSSAMIMEKNSGHALSIPTTSISIPGITSVTASATVISPAAIYFGPVGGSVSTAQVQLSITPVINIGSSTSSTPCNLTLSNLLGLVGCLLYLAGMPIGVTLNGSLPINVTAAGATGTLAAINCAAPSITVSSTTQAVNLNAAANLNVNVTLAGSTILNAASINIAAGAKTAPFSTSTTFLYPGEFGPSHAKTVGSGSLGLNGLLNVTSANVSVLNSSLLSGVTSGLIQGLAAPLLNTLLGSLDTALTLPLQALGVKLGGADIAALGYTCNGLRLAA